MRYSNNLLVATVWIAGRMLDYTVHQYMLCEVWPSSTLGLRQSAKKICEIFNIDRSNLSKIDIDEFVLGVRCQMGKVKELFIEMKERQLDMTLNEYIKWKNKYGKIGNKE